jgi:phosphopantothenoylcysteine decarboxylase/phosphopantothenate--cysteine ligase
VTKKRIVLGVGGGIACFKAVMLASQLTQKGIEVFSFLTPAAQAFVQALSFEGVTKSPAITDHLQVDSRGISVTLIAGEVDAMIIAPATADLIGKIAAGFGGDPVSLAALVAPEQRFFCPAMNDRMWKNPLVQRNVRILEDAGWERIGPEEGHLAEGYSAPGRMAEPETILGLILKSLD